MSNFNPRQYITIAELLEVKQQVQEQYSVSLSDGEIDVVSAMYASQLSLLDRLIVKAKQNKN